VQGVKILEFSKFFSKNRWHFRRLGV
jgi:hypothetical protein